MKVILNIDTSVETASVSVSKDGVLLSYLKNTIQKDHASFLHNAVNLVLTESSLDIKELDAIAVVNGPGSYTGLRVGLSSAKGLCYALNKPLITIGTLNALAAAAISSSKEPSSGSALFCPMIDARRMEVYTAIFDDTMTERIPASALILHESSFEKMLTENNMFFFGSGSVKWRNMINSKKAYFVDAVDATAAICQLSHTKYLNNDFSNLSYCEPLYVKEFFSP